MSHLYLTYTLLVVNRKLNVTGIEEMDTVTLGTVLLLIWGKG